MPFSALSSTFIARPIVPEKGTDYSLKLTDFLKEISPEFKLPASLSFLKDQTICTLNLVLQLVKDLYTAGKENMADIGSAFIHVINFYIGTKNSESWTELSIGFASLALSLFKLDSVKLASKHIQRIVDIFFTNLKSFFVKAESAEKIVTKFWTNVTVSDPRSLFGMVQACSGIFTSILCLKTFVDKSFTEKDISTLITEVSTGILVIGKDVKQHAKNISVFLARVYDWVFMNAEALMKLQFDKIIWELPSEQVFESKFVEITNIMNSYYENGLYLENNNLTLEILRNNLHKLRDSGDAELNKCPVPSARSAIARYLTQLDGHIRFVEDKLNPENTKPQPMSVTLVGSAGCGKSSASTKLGFMMQAIANRVPDESLIKNRGGDPKFEENISGSTDIIIFDDYANDQSRKMHTKEVLDIVNTSREVIPRSKAEEKGLFRYSNVGTVFTTNDVEIGINCFRSASLESLMRRLGIVLFMAIHEEFCIPGTDRLDLNHPAVRDESFNTDIYQVIIKKPIGVSEGSGCHHVDYVVVDYERHDGNNEWRDAVLKLQEMLDSEWTQSVARHEKAQLKENFCKSCNIPKDMCICGMRNEKAKVRSDETFEFTPHAESLFGSHKVAPSLFFKKASNSAQQRFYALDASILDFSSFLAAKISLFIFYKNVAFYAIERAWFYTKHWHVVMPLFLLSFLIPFGPIILVTMVLVWEYKIVDIERKAQFERDLINGVAIVNSAKSRYSIYGVTFLTGALALTAVFSSLISITKVLLKSEHKVVETEDITPANPTYSRLVSKDDPYLKEISELKENAISFAPVREKTSSDKLGYFLTKPRPAHEARTMSEKEMVNAIGKGIAEAVVTDSDGVTNTVKCLPMGSERLIPRHALPVKGNMDISVHENRSTFSGYVNIDVPPTHVSPLKKNGLVKDKILDAALVHLPNSPPGKDFYRYFAEAGTLPSQAGCTYVHKDCDTGSFELVGVRARLLKLPIRYSTANGIELQYVYECEAQNHKSSDGDCGQPLLYNNAIIGIHIAGTGTNKWYCLAVDKSTLQRANDVLKQESSIFVASHPPEPVFKNNMKGLSIVDEPTDYVNRVLQVSTTPIISLGTVLDPANQIFKPRAEDYYFRNGNTQIETEFGPMSARPPKYVNGEKQISTTLAKFNEPKMTVPIALMDRAAHDYVYQPTSDGKTLAGVAKEFSTADPDFFRVRPLQEALDGDGTGVVRGMNNQTSSGVCYGGVKTKHMETDINGDACIPRVLADYVEADVMALEKEWRSGQGTFDPFSRASKTNEVLPMKKAYEKTRSVYGNDMSFFIAATRGIIPLKSVLRDMEVSECYVGLAAQSQQWGKFHDHITKDGEYTKFVCGDFSGYDTQLPKALLEKAAAIIVQMYRENGSSESDVEYLRGFLSSVVSPAMIWEGNLLQFCSGQPSGQPLTVEMNSIVNSILLRMAFFTIMDKYYPEIKDPNYRLYVRTGVYGDDNVFGVSDSIPMFNHTTIQAVFASWGIKYTMADKDADSVPFQTIEEVSFLKRSFRYHADLDAIVAPIEEASLCKKFYWWTKSKNTPLKLHEQFAANFESQAREAYLHGPEFYLDFCAKCERIVLASQDGDERFILPWNTIQPLSADEMRGELVANYHPENDKVAVDAFDGEDSLTYSDSDSDLEGVNFSSGGNDVWVYAESKVQSPSTKEISEEEQVDNLVELIRIPSHLLYNVQKNVKIANFGEIDLCVRQGDCILVAECKRSQSPTTVQTAVKQATKYASVVALLQPDTRVFGVIYTHFGVRVVYDNGNPYRSKVFESLFSALGYTPVEGDRL